MRRRESALAIGANLRPRRRDEDKKEKNGVQRHLLHVVFRTDGQDSFNAVTWHLAHLTANPCGITRVGGSSALRLVQHHAGWRPGQFGSFNFRLERSVRRTRDAVALRQWVDLSRSTVRQRRDCKQVRDVMTEPRLICAMRWASTGSFGHIEARTVGESQIRDETIRNAAWNRATPVTEDLVITMVVSRRVQHSLAFEHAEVVGVFSEDPIDLVNRVNEGAGIVIEAMNQRRRPSTT